MPMMSAAERFSSTTTTMWAGVGRADTVNPTGDWTRLLADATRIATTASALRSAYIRNRRMAPSVGRRRALGGVIGPLLKYAGNAPIPCPRFGLIRSHRAARRPNSERFGLPPDRATRQSLLVAGAPGQAHNVGSSREPVVDALACRTVGDCDADHLVDHKA